MKNPLSMNDPAVVRKLRSAWHGMKWRCKYEPAYAGRGIRVCVRWQRSFAAFAIYMGAPPSMAHSVDRIDNDGNYEPGNCRWATASQQARNKQSTRALVYQGVEVDAPDFADVMGFDRSALNRYLNHGMTGEEILADRWKNRRLILVKRQGKNLRRLAKSLVDVSVESE